VNASRCGEIDIRRGSDAFRLTQIIFQIQCYAIAGISLLVWRYRSERVEYLGKRNFVLISLLSLGFVANSLGAPVGRMISLTDDLDEFNAYAWCIVQNFSHTFVVPILGGVQIIRLYLFRQRVLYTRLVAAAVDKLRTRELDDKEIAELKMTKYKASSEFANRLALLLVIVSTVLSFIFVSLNCPVFDPDKECTFTVYGNSGVYQVCIIVVVTGAIIYASRLNRGAPDPFHLLEEIQRSMLFPAFLGVSGAVLGYFDPGNFNEKDPITWSWGFFADIAVYLFMLNSYPYQIYKSYRMEREGNTHYRLSDILKDDTGAKLFEQHLLNEFSVENLTFWKTVKRWKEKFDETPRDIRKIEAENIIRRWIDEGGLFQLNISSGLFNKVKNRFTNEILVAKDLFDEIQRDIYRLMESDSFRRFVDSPMFQQFAGLGDLQAVPVESRL